MKIFLSVSVFFLMFSLTSPLWPASHRRPAKQQAPSDPGYVFALAAANHFLNAWQSGDLENGMVLLSDGIRHSQNADKLEQFFSTGTDNARAFEIARARRHRSRYRFPVVLVTARGSHITRKSSEIVLVETGKNDWVVDKLP